MNRVTSTPQADLPAPRPRVGQIVLAGLLVVIITLLVVWSFLATRAHEVERATVFAEEADSTAMTFVQRESFNTLLLLERWSTGDVSAREVQIARANLGQRLGVRVNSGRTTGEIVQDEYRTALAALDPHLLRISEITDDERAQFRREISGEVDQFAAQTRELSKVFQALIREQVTSVLEERALAERWQALLLGVVLFVGSALALWFMRDINTFYRRSKENLIAERDELERVRRRVTSLQLIGQAATRWHEKIDAAATRDEVLDLIRADLARYLPGVTLTISASERDHVVLGGATDSLDTDDVEYIRGRIVDAVQSLVAHERSRAALEHERLHDSLTGLPNRQQLTDIVAAHSLDSPFVAVAILDIDRFTEVNSAFGVSAGDRVLRSVAEALTSPDDGRSVIRLASDDFAVVLRGEKPSALLTRVQAMANAIPPAVAVEKGIAPLSVSVGLTVARTSHEFTADTLMARALAALQLSRTASARNTVVVFDESRHADLLRRVTEEAELRRALDAGDINVVLQPIVDLNSRELVGVEALARWYRGDAVVTPDHFLPILHRAGLFDEFTNAICARALDAWKRLTDICDLTAGGSGRRVPYVAINVHAQTLSDPQFVDHLASCATERGIALTEIVVEITEDAVVQSSPVLDTLAALRDNGVRIAIDDFGTGYSSLGQATAVPMDILKIDRSFIPGVGSDSAATRLFGDLVGIGRTLDVVLVAEGVETEAVARELSALGVDCAQGFHFARPQPVDDLGEWFRRHHRRAATR